MRVFIDNAGSNMFAGGIDGFSSSIAQVFADGCNLAILHQYICIFHLTIFFIGPDGGIFYQDGFLFGHFFKTIGQEWIGYLTNGGVLSIAGGVGFGRFDRTYTQTNLNPPAGFETFSTNKTKWAWVAGFGSEWAIWNNWSIQSEVLYARFEKDEVTFTCAAVIT